MPVAQSDQDFDIVKAPLQARGKLTPIVASKPESGMIYTDVDGLYTFLMLSSWQQRSVEGGGQRFETNTGYKRVLCQAGRFRYRSGLTTLTAMQRAPDAALRQSVEEQTKTQDKVVGRDTLNLGDGGWPRRTPVRLITWDVRSGMAEMVFAAVETPASTIGIVCGGKNVSFADARRTIYLTFRLAEGALQAPMAVEQTESKSTLEAVAPLLEAQIAAIAREEAFVQQIKSLMASGQHQKALQVARDRPWHERVAIVLKWRDVPLEVLKDLAKQGGKEDIVILYRREAQQLENRINGLLACKNEYESSKPRQPRMPSIWEVLRRSADGQTRITPRPGHVVVYDVSQERWVEIKPEPGKWPMRFDDLVINRPPPGDYEAKLKLAEQYYQGCLARVRSSW